MAGLLATPQGERTERAGVWALGLREQTRDSGAVIDSKDFERMALRHDRRTTHRRAAAIAVFICLFGHLGAIGLVGPDEPRYAWIARAMARTGDWVTPRLYGQPWFEKPILYYWAAAAGFLLHLPAEWAARCPPLSRRLSRRWPSDGWGGSYYGEGLDFPRVPRCSRRCCFRPASPPSDSLAPRRPTCCSRRRSRSRWPARRSLRSARRFHSDSDAGRISPRGDTLRIFCSALSSASQCWRKDQRPFSSPAERSDSGRLRRNIGERRCGWRIRSRLPPSAVALPWYVSLRAAQSRLPSRFYFSAQLRSLSDSCFSAPPAVLVLRADHRFSPCCRGPCSLARGAGRPPCWRAKNRWTVRLDSSLPAGRSSRSCFSAFPSRNSPAIFFPAVPPLALLLRCRARSHLEPPGSARIRHDRRRAWRCARTDVGRAGPFGPALDAAIFRSYCVVRSERMILSLGIGLPLAGGVLVARSRPRGADDSFGAAYRSRWRSMLWKSPGLRILPSLDPYVSARWHAQFVRNDLRPDRIFTYHLHAPGTTALRFILAGNCPSGRGGSRTRARLDHSQGLEEMSRLGRFSGALDEPYKGSSTCRRFPAPASVIAAAKSGGILCRKKFTIWFS